MSTLISFIKQWFADGDIVFRMPRYGRQWIEAGVMSILVLGGIWFASTASVVATRAELEPGCTRKPCFSVDVRRSALAFPRLAIGGCAYVANLYVNEDLLASKRFMFESGCPQKVDIRWNGQSHCTIDFGGDQVQLIFSGKNLEWRHGAP